MSVPTNIDQYPEADNNISWNPDNFFRLKTLDRIGGVVSTRPLMHISRQPRNDIAMKTYFLRTTGYTFVNLPNTISGIQATVMVDRGGRIQDETIQLCYQGALIGESRAKTSLDPSTVYGSSTDLWGVSDLSQGMITDSSFGLVLRYQSHRHWPHRTSPKIISVELQIY